MLKYVYGFATKTNTFKECVPFINVKKLPNIVPYISNLVTYLPFLLNSNTDEYSIVKHKLHHNIEIVEEYDSRVSTIKPAIISVEGSFGESFGNIPHFLKPHLASNIHFKWFPESFMQIYLKEYSVFALGTSDPLLESDAKSITRYGTLQSISSCLIESDIHLFEAIYKTKSSKQ